MVRDVRYGDDGDRCVISGAGLFAVQIGDERFGPFDKADYLVPAYEGHPCGFTCRRMTPVASERAGKSTAPYKEKTTAARRLAFSPFG